MQGVVMRKLKRSECGVLHLVLKHKWYDMIASGEKREEYRDATLRWRVRLQSYVLNTDGRFVVAFSRGYRKPSMWFILENLSGPKLTARHPEWGEPDTLHYVIALGERVEIESGVRE